MANIKSVNKKTKAQAIGMHNEFLTGRTQQKFLNPDEADYLIIQDSRLKRTIGIFLNLYIFLYIPWKDTCGTFHTRCFGKFYSILENSKKFQTNSEKF